MFKTNYYYLVAGFQDLTIETQKLSSTSVEMFKELQNFVTKEDYSLIETLFLDTDNKNILNKILKKDVPFDSSCVYPEEYINEQIKEPTDIKKYIADFIIQYKDDQSIDSVRKEIILFEKYYEFCFSLKNDFLKNWTKFNVDLKNVSIAYNCHTYGYSTEKQLIKTKFSENLYTTLLKNKPKLDIIKDDLPYADKIVQIIESEKNLLDKEKELDAIKFAFLEDYTFFNYFTVEKVLVFLIKYRIIERWLKLDKEHGKKLFDELIKREKNNDKLKNLNS